MRAESTGVERRPPSPRATPGLTVEVDGTAPRAWDATLAGFRDASWEQSAAWVHARWGARRASRLLVRQGGVPIGGAHVVVLALARGRLPGVAYVKFGPFWRRDDGPGDGAAYRTVVTALVDEYCVRRGHCLTILPRPGPAHVAGETAILHELGFAVRRPMYDPNRYLVDLRLPAAERMQALEQKWRYNLRHALRAGIDCRLADGDPAFEAFTALHDRMVARKRFDDPGATALLPALAAGLPEAMRPHTVLALHEGRIVAGAVVAVCGDTAWYVLGASSEEALPLKAGYALQWWVIGWLAEAGARWYDLGGEGGEAGLRQFKKGLVGKRGVVLTGEGELERAASPGARLAGRVVFTLRDVRRAVRRWRPR
jgi:hypothetical protein